MNQAGCPRKDSQPGCPPLQSRFGGHRPPSDRGKPHSPNQRAARIDEPPVHREPSAGSGVVCINPGLGGESRAGARGCHDEVHRRQHRPGGLRCSICLGCRWPRLPPTGDHRRPNGQLRRRITHQIDEATPNGHVDQGLAVARIEDGPGKGTPTPSNPSENAKQPDFIGPNQLGGPVNSRRRGGGDDFVELRELPDRGNRVEVAGGGRDPMVRRRQPCSEGDQHRTSYHGPQSGTRDRPSAHPRQPSD